MSEKEPSTRQKIIEVARKSFMKDGYKSTSTRRIAKEAGVTQPNLYYHFSNKEELYIAVLDSVADEVESDLKSISHAEELELKDKLSQMTTYLKETHPLDFYMMMHDLEEELSAEAGLRLYHIWQNAYQKPFSDLFESYQCQLRQDVPVKVAASYYFLIIAPYVSQRTNIRRSLSIEKIIDLYLNGVMN